MPASGGGFAERPCRPASPHAGASRSSRACPSLRTGNLPGIGRFERVLNELLPERSLRFVLGLRVAEEQHVAELDCRFTVVLRELVGVELRERPRQPALYARRKRLLLFLPVESHELAEFVGALDHALERFRHERT